jgi:tetratricopeptide (TPR) repeat protein
MAHTVETRVETPTAELRDALNRAERQLPVLDSSSLVEYLRSLDRIEELMESLTAESVDLRSEMTRWLDLQARLGASAGHLMKLARPLGGFAALRTANPPAVNGWWRLDELVAADRKRSWTRWLVIALVAGAVLAVSAFVYQRWLAPSPEVILAVSAVNDVEQLAMESKWDEAFALTEKTLQQVPDNPDLLVWAGVLSERRGDTAKAQEYLARAQQVLGDPMRYQVALSMRRLQASDLDGAEAAAQAALAINPKEPQAVFFLANVAEMRNQPEQALDLYMKTADLAEDSNPQLTVVAKMRYGMLLQQMNYSMGTAPAEAATPEATPAAAPAGTPAPASAATSENTPAP